MKKVVLGILLLICMFCICGCGMEKSARDVAIEYLELYRNKDKVVIDELDEFIENENLTDEQKEKYKDILEREYGTLMYKVVDEQYEGNVAFITMEITVIDLYKSQEESAKYFNDNPTKFNDEDGEYDRDIYTDYKLDMMSKETDTVTYTIDIKVEKDGDDWKVVQLSNESLEKIHGIYNYEE